MTFCGMGGSHGSFGRSSLMSYWGFSGGNSLVGRQNTEEGSQHTFMGEQGESARVELVNKDIDGRMEPCLDHCCGPHHPCVLLMSDFGLSIGL